MSQVIHHTTDWSASTLISWGIVTALCLLYPAGGISLYWQLPIHALILVLLWHSIRKPNEQVRVIAAVYWLSLMALIPLTNTSLVLIHMVMFTALFSVHFSWPIMSGLIGAILGEYLAYYWWLSGSFVWSTVAIWAGFALMNGIISNKIVESLNMHYQSKQNYEELKATQGMLQAMSAEQERLHISHELHDVLGHKLTALSINLDYLKRTADESSKEMLSSCHQISQEILEEVREIVSSQRTGRGALKLSLENLISQTPNLKCSVHLVKELENLNGTPALCIVRFCQEMINNTLKHTQASELSFSIRLSNESVSVIEAEASHNQPEHVLPIKKNGLKGLSERLDAVGGAFFQEIEDGILVNQIRLPFKVQECCDD